MKTCLLLLVAFVAAGGLVMNCRQRTVDVVVDCPQPSGESTPTPTINNLSAFIPNITVQVQPTTNRASFVMTGVYDPVARQFMELKDGRQGGQNLWLEEDGVNRGFTIKELNTTQTPLPIDMAFIVDNSGSMGQEADSVAAQMVRFANYLGQQRLDVRFGSVGHFGRITGALNLTTAQGLNSYLNRTGYRSTSRTTGYGGDDATTLQQRANTHNVDVVTVENTNVAVYFADKYFNWRQGALRVYICFTDDVTHTNNHPIYNNTYFRANWKTEQGTIHSVQSLDDYYWKGAVADTALFMRNPPYSSNPPLNRPWELAQFTGGTIKFIHSDCRDLSLVNLPVAQALSKAYTVEFCTTNASTEHTLKLTMRQPNRTVDGSRTFRAVYKK